MQRAKLGPGAVTPSSPPSPPNPPTHQPNYPTTRIPSIVRYNQLTFMIIILGSCAVQAEPIVAGNCFQTQLLLISLSTRNVLFLWNCRISVDVDMWIGQKSSCDMLDVWQDSHDDFECVTWFNLQPVSSLSYYNSSFSFSLSLCVSRCRVLLLTQPESTLRAKKNALSCISTAQCARACAVLLMVGN